MTYGVLRTFFGVAVALGIVSAAQAQEGKQEGKTRAPMTGLAVLDCAPSKPAPGDSCLVRIPSGSKLDDIRYRSLGDRTAEFVKVVDKLSGNLTMSATMVLIDLSVGAGNGRLRSWNRERELISRVVANLPSDEKVAIYGFGNNIVELSRFSTSQTQAEDTIKSLEIQEQNTLLLANSTRAIELLSQQDDVLLKNLILITDGDDEGLVRDSDFRDFSEAAENAGVSVSALGMFWRAKGDQRTTRGIDVLKSLTDPQKGLMKEVFLQDQQAAIDAVSNFIQTYENAIEGSGLLIPVGDPAPARITIEMIEPVVGRSGQTQTNKYSAEFRPITAAAREPTEPEEDDTLIFGLPALYVYIGVSILALLVLLLAVLLLRRSGTIKDDVPNISELTGRNDSPTVANMSPPVAYLVRVDNGHRFPVRTGRWTIGRSSTNAVVIPDGGVSRVHAELSGSPDGKFTLSDLGSLNGTLVNDRKIKGAQRINVGDTVGLGAVRMKLVRG